jgi:hypothetical protein
MVAPAMLFVALAVAFIGLNYYLGVLFASIPGLTRIKNAGWTMMEDSVLSLTLLIFLMAFIAVWNAIMNVVSPTMIFGILPVYNPYAALQSYAKAETWILTQRSQAQQLGVLLNVIPIALQGLDKAWWSFGLGGLVGSWVSSAVSPWSNAVNIYIILLSFVSLWTGFIGPPGNFWALFMLVGAFLYALPARIGRVAGAWLIAVPISYVTALPFLPGFVDTFAGSIYDSILNQIGQTIWNGILQWPPTLDFNTITQMTLTFANPGTIVVVRLILVSLYVGFIAALSRSIAGILAGTTPPSIGAEPG